MGKPAEGAWTGCSPPRLEDDRLLRGRGRYIADLRLPGMAHAVFVRAPVAHGRIVSLSVDEARAAPGVLAVIAGPDLLAGGIHPLPCIRAIESVDGLPFHAPVRHALAVETVRHVGEPVALVVAETEAEAVAAADLVAVDYDMLDVTIDPLASAERAFLWRRGDEAATQLAFARAARVVSIETANPRILINPLEPRGAIACYDAGEQRYTLFTPTQGVHLVRRLIAPTLGIDTGRLRVVTNDVGGSFGAKLVNVPEQTALLFAARTVGRPVRWIATRSESHLADIAGRDQVNHMALALDEAGRILALRAENWANLGGYASAIGPSPPTGGFLATCCGPYRIPAISVTVHGVYTNTAPTDAFRGSGKPEAIYVLERLIERAGSETGLGPVEIRRRNLIPASALPYTAPNGYVYDNADFEAVMDRALAAADWAGFAGRRAESAARGCRRGIGLGLYVHMTGVISDEVSRVRVGSDGLVVAETGTQSSGQGHETGFAQIVAGQLGVPLECVRVVQGDSALSDHGGPTAGSSSLQVGGVTLVRAVEAMLERAAAQAAKLLQCEPASIAYADGRFHGTGTGASIDLFALAAELERAGEGGCAGEASLDGNILSVPNGAYVCEVEIDPETGHVAILRFTAIDDVGRRLNPVIVAGQIHGGIAQGIGQSLHERAVYDADSGQMLTGSLMDYGLPRADDLPVFDLGAADIPTTNNRLGMKGAGEIGVIGAPAAVINAVVGAIGTDRIEMPATPERIWRALHMPV